MFFFFQKKIDQQQSAQPGTSNQMVVSAPPQFHQAAVGMSHPYYSFPSCQGIYHHHNISYPHNQMQMYISAPPQGFQYNPQNHVNAQQQTPPFVAPVPNVC